MTTPNTKAGRALLRALNAADIHSARVDRHGVVTIQQDILTIEAEAAEPYRKALEPLYWFYMMVKSGGPDMSDLDEAVMQDAAKAAERADALLRREVGE